MYQDCRKSAGISLLTAEALLNMGRKRIVRIEYGEEEVPPDKVVLMDDLYQAQSRLMMWHCGNGCSVGKCLGYQYYEISPSLAGVKILNSAENIIKKRHDLLTILDDGKITPDELPRLEDLCEDYKTIRAASLALEVEKEKHRLSGAEKESHD
ncbi:MAG: hypothetical protein H6Q73_163 [Firmicutes bacterium]|nr:hypothetical protein [Bacillota bacterium]